MVWWLIQEVPWPIVCVFLPLVLATLAYVLGSRVTHGVGWISAVAMPAVAGGLLAQVARLGPVRYEIAGWGSPLGIDLYADSLSSLLIAMSAVVGAAVSVYAGAYFAADKQLFWPVWLFVWSALNALFLSADLFNAYVTMELLTLGSVILIALSANAAALVATLRYLLLALLGSLLYLLGVALIYSQAGTLEIVSLGPAAIGTPPVQVAQVAMTLGLLLKTALVPLHFWLPAAHASAPAPVSAVLSGLIVKASFYLLLRLWLVTFTPAATVAIDHVLGVLGSVAILWGSWQAIRAERLKMLVAYSTVAQIGYLFLLFPLARQAGPIGTVLSAVLLFAVSHACAKAATFLVTGIVLKSEGHDRIADLHGLGNRLPLAIFAFSLAAVSLMGLPPSGGFAAKWLMLQSALSAGQWHWAGVILIGGLLAAVYLFRVLGCALETRPQHEPGPGRGTIVGRLHVPALLLGLIACCLGFAGSAVVAFIEGGTSLPPGGLIP